MTIPCDEKLAASRTSQIQPTGSNPSLLPIHIILPSDFSAGYYVKLFVVCCFSVVENKYANSVAAVVVAVEPVATTVAAAWDFVLFLSVV